MPPRLRMHARGARGHEASDAESNKAPSPGARGRGCGRGRSRDRDRARGRAGGQADKLAPETGMTGMMVDL